MKYLQIGIPTERGDKIWRPVSPPARKGGGDSIRDEITTELYSIPPDGGDEYVGLSQSAGSVVM